MLKVLHTGDWHIGSFPGPEVGGQNARFQDICRCLDFQAMYAEEHRPDLIVVSGDIFHQARVWSDRGLRESRTAIDHIRRLSNVAPTVVLRGTPNHDSEEQFEMLVTAFYGDDSVSVVTEPEVLHIHTYHGQRVDVACIPGFDRGVHRAAHPGLSREEETQVFTDELAKVVLGLKAQCEPGVASILSTHFTVPGCNMESGQTALFAQFEPVIYPDTLKAADFDLVALGHIHRPQQLPEAGRAVFYCGSITGLNFNDEDQPRGFYIHDIDDDGEAWSEYVETPYREFETIRLGEDDVRAMLSAERVVVPDRLKGKIVRVLYTCSDETNKAFNKAVLEKRLYDGGVFYVSEITPEEITASVNRDELHGDNSPEQNLAEYLTEKEKSPEDAQRIIELARPIISEAMEKGRLETPTGVFMPVEIEVKNYRNYRDELFSYDGISFATINGENGAGKSSLFMDAMLDALFEEPREGDLTGWICNDPDGLNMILNAAAPEVLAETRAAAEEILAVLNTAAQEPVSELGIGADKVGGDVAEIMKFRVASEVERDAGLEAVRPAVRIRTGRAVGKVGHRGCSHPDGGLVFTRTAEERANLDALALHGTSIPDTVREQGHGRVIPGSFQTLKNGHISYASISMSSSSMLPYTQCSEISRALLRAEGSETASILRSVT